MDQQQNPTTKRRRAYALGHHGETIALWWLRIHGWRILMQRARTPVGEIDLVAKRGRALAFIEVKARATHQAALESITPHQTQRIARAAHLLLSQNPSWGELDMRMDVITIAPWSLPRHISNAYPLSGEPF